MWSSRREHCSNSQLRANFSTGLNLPGAQAPLSVLPEPPQEFGTYLLPTTNTQTDSNNVLNNVQCSSGESTRPHIAQQRFQATVI